MIGTIKEPASLTRALCRACEIDAGGSGFGSLGGFVERVAEAVASGVVRISCSSLLTIRWSAWIDLPLLVGFWIGFGRTSCFVRKQYRPSVVRRVTCDGLVGRV